jgi:peptidoglycan hydrolase-like amidase
MSTVTVRVTGEHVCHDEIRYHVQYVEIDEYVAGVLPNEWGNDWPDESLKAGAVAIRQYAIRQMLGKGYVWDCTWDQVYGDYGWATEATERNTGKKAFILDLQGNLAVTYFNANRAGCNTQSESCMSQWESKELAEQGYSWIEILEKSYKGRYIYLPFDRLDWNVSWTLY